ncbi:hypothetical protein D3C87_1217400 [compost metagenome]
MIDVIDVHHIYINNFDIFHIILGFTKFYNLKFSLIFDKKILKFPSIQDIKMFMKKHCKATTYNIEGNFLMKVLFMYF